MANQTYRVLELIRRFKNNEKVCISQLKNETMWYGKSDKTIFESLEINKSDKSIIDKDLVKYPET